jgi:hypothetical protein
MARGINSTLLIKKQPEVNVVPSFGTTAADAANLMPFTDESLRAQVNQVQSQALRRNAMRQRKLSTPGTIGVDGDFNIEATNAALHTLFPLLFNSVVNTTAPVVDAGAAPTVYTREYRLTTANRSLASIMVDDGEVARGFANMVNTQFSLASSVDQLVKIGTTWSGTHFKPSTSGEAFGNGITGNVVVPGQSYTVPTVEYGLYFDQAKLEIGSAIGTVYEVEVSDFNLSVNLNADTNRNRLGSRYRRDIPTGIADVTGSFTMDANSIPVGATGGLSTRDWAYKAVMDSTYLALKFSFTDPINLAGGQPSTLAIELPYILIDMPAWNVSGPDIVGGAINFTGFADGDNGLVVKHKYALDKSIPAA